MNNEPIQKIVKPILVQDRSPYVLNVNISNYQDQICYKDMKDCIPVMVAIPRENLNIEIKYLLHERIDIEPDTGVVMAIILRKYIHKIYNEDKFFIKEEDFGRINNISNLTITD